MKTDELVLSAAEGRVGRLLRALANPARFRIVALLAERKECAAMHLAAALPLAQSTLSEHLAALREAELVQTSGEGVGRISCLDAASLEFLAAYLAALAQRERSWEELVMSTRADGRLEIRDARVEDASAIARIYNQGIEDRVATLETQLRSPEERAEWLAARGPRHPVLVAQDGGGAVLGWASLNAFNPRAAYDHVADLSVYVAREHRGRGIGDALLGALEQRARGLGYHKLVLAAFPSNAPGMRLYERHGFATVGIYREQGQLDGCWVDVIAMEKLLD
jgi:L-amino acid N-acyltransferase YncA/DNA-binding MarR family transcriptional regulator